MVTERLIADLNKNEVDGNQKHFIINHIVKNVMQERLHPNLRRLAVFMVRLNLRLIAIYHVLHQKCSPTTNQEILAI